MSSEQSNERRKYSSLNGLGRTAMIAGIPLIPAIIVLAVFLSISFVLQIFFGIVAFLSVIFLIPILFFMRQLTATDDGALRVFGLEMLCIIKRKNYKLFGKTLTFLSSEYGANVKSTKSHFIKPKQRK